MFLANDFFLIFGYISANLKQYAGIHLIYTLPSSAEV